MVHETIHRIPPSLPADELLARLLASWPLRREPDDERSRSYYDTFDWRLHRADLRLVREDDHYRLERPGGGELAAGPAEGRPRFWRDFPPGPLQDALRKRLGIRSLVHLATLERRGPVLVLLDHRERAVARMALEEVALLHRGRRLSLGMALSTTSLRGRRADRARRVELLESWGLRPLPQGLLPLALARLGMVPGGYDPRLRIPLESDLPAGVAVRRILRHLLQVVRRNEPGILADIDTEFLHDFRVAVRRTRAALGQLGRVFEPGVARGWHDRFDVLGRRTNRLRDLDVFLLEQDALRALLPPGLHAGFATLCAELAHERSGELAGFRTYLESEEHRALLEGWEAFLDPPGSEAGGTRDARRPALELARRRITKRHRRLLKLGRRIDDTSPDSDLHRLRIRGKNLRYLLEFFAALFPAAEHRHLIRQLKRLQDNLGEFNDLHVQQVFLRARLDPGRPRPATEAAAIGGLLVQLRVRQAEVRREYAATFARFAGPENARIFARLYGAQRRGRPAG